MKEKPPAPIDSEQILRALIKGLGFLVGQLKKVLRGELI